MNDISIHNAGAGKETVL